jgi:hypothetical protein
VFPLLAPPVDAWARFPVDFPGGLARSNVDSVGRAMVVFGRARGLLGKPVDGPSVSRGNQLPTVDIPEPVVLFLFISLSLPSSPGRAEVAVGVMVSST